MYEIAEKDVTNIEKMIYEIDKLINEVTKACCIDN